jgi:type VI protein secretion system component VasF
MRSETAALVDPVLTRACGLRDSLAVAPVGSPEGARLMEQGRTELTKMLARVQNAEMAAGLATGGDYLGIGYPLTCWIDELMTEDLQSGALWNENKLEGELYGSNDRAWMFWRQAELAETLGREETLAVCYLCVSLGFTGTLRKDPQKLSAWMHRMRVRIGLVPELKLPFAHDLAPATDAPPLRGASLLQRASTVGWVASVVLLPLLSFLAVHTWVR